MNWGFYIAKLRTERNLTQQELASKSGIGRSRLSRIELGHFERHTQDDLKNLAKALEMTTSEISQIIYGESKEQQGNVVAAFSPEAALSKLEVSIKAYIPVYSEVSAGEGMEPIDWVASTTAKPAPSSYRAYRVDGLCLEPDILEGDTVIIDTALDPENKDLVVCILEGKAYIKRFRENDDGEKWIENKYGKYRPEDVHTTGVVVELSRKTR